MQRLVTAILLLLIALPLHARNVEGVNVPDTLTVGSDRAALTLNGAGLRTRYLAKIYVAALYLPEPATTPEAVLASNAARVMAIHMRRDSDSEQIASAFLTSIAKNHDRTEMAALQERMTQFRLMMPNMKRDDVLLLEFTPNGETRVVVNSNLQGTIAGADFQRAMLRIWLGTNPVDGDLKRALLGAQRQ